MDEMGEAKGTADAARVSRRKALKAGAAVGVGAAAWAAPNIKTLGFAPAYATHCTPGQFQCSTTPKQESSPSQCGGTGQSAVFDLKALVFTGPITVVQSNGTCAGTTTLTITGVPADYDCQVTLEGFLQSNPSVLEISISTTPSTDRVVVVPLLIRSDVSSASLFTRAIVCCAPPGCLH